MDKYLRPENATFCSSNCNFLRFSAYNLPLLLIFFFYFLEVFFFYFLEDPPNEH